MACIVEEHHDERGIARPISVAPYRAHLVSIGAHRDAAVRDAAEGLYQRLTDARVDVLRRSRRVARREAHRCRAAGMPTSHRRRRARRRGGVEVTDRATGEGAVQPLEALEAELRGTA